MTEQSNRALATYQPPKPMEVPDTEVQAYANRVLAYAAKSGKDGVLFSSDLTPVQAAQLARVAIAYSLDPFMGELTIYKGKPYVTIDGRTRLALNHPQYDGMQCEPASEEQRKAFRCGDQEHLWYAAVWRKDKSHVFTAYGRSAYVGDTNFAVKTHGQEIARKRALYRALRDAFSIPLPNQAADADWEAAEWAATSHEIAPEQLRGGSFSEIRTDVQPGTGEIIDVEAREINEIRPDQTTAIHAIYKAIGWSEEDYRGFLQDAHGVDSSTQLTEGQASGIIESLSAIQGKDEGKRKLEEVRERLKFKGFDLKALWGAWGDEEAAEPVANPTATVVAHEPSTVESVVIDADPVQDGPTLFDATPSTAEQRKALERMDPKQTKGLDWSKITYESASDWIASLQPAETPR